MPQLAIVSSCAPGKEPTKQTLVGMLTVHVICDRVIFEIPPHGLDRDLLVNTEFAALSTGIDFVAPGSVVDNRVVRLIRLGNKILLEDVRYEILKREQPNLQRGVEAASLRTVIRVFDIIGEGTGGAPQIDVTSVFTSEVPAGFALDLMRHFHMRAVDPKRSYVQTVKVFPGSVDVRFYQTWMADPAELRAATDTEDRPATLGFIFHASILALPQTPMRGRYADDRVGYFTVPFDDYGTGEHGRVRRAYIQRYRLEKKDAAAEVSEPVKPIVFYLSQEVPDQWRPYIKRGIEDWQKVFENAGFRNAIIARDAPTPQEDPNWDPEDVRYNVVRWTPSGRQNAMGPAVIDPRSGEVISSHAIFWHDVLRLVETWYFTQVGPLDPRARKLPLPAEITGELLRYIVTHEIGHALGLRHNFKGHSAYSIAQLRSREWTEKWGNSASIMDYSRLNYVAQPGDNAYLLPQVRTLRLLCNRVGIQAVHADRRRRRQKSQPGDDQRHRVEPPGSTGSAAGHQSDAALRRRGRRGCGGPAGRYARGRRRPDRGGRPRTPEHRPGNADADPRARRNSAAATRAWPSCTKH